MNKVTFKPLYSIGELVKVQVFNRVMRGEVLSRTYYEKADGVEISIKYLIQYEEGFDEVVYCWEEDLTFVKDLPIGEIR